jgi:lambda family phage minor tail protein L
MPIAADIQRLDPGAEIRLYQIDMTSIGGGVLNYVPGTLDGQAVRWKGQQYIPLPIDADGFEKAAQGSLPTPTLTVAKDVLIAAAVVSFDDLRGARVIRWRTFVKYLDGQPQADPNQHFPPDIFRIERKVLQNKTMIRWELAADLDQQGRQIPGRVATKNHCPWRYRFWNGGSFTYSSDPHACPYAGAAMFLPNGNPTGDPAQDRCGKRLSDCRKRFGAIPLPYGGFPGIGSGKS